MASLEGKVLFITGASRGIGKAIALRAARDGAKIVIAAKTAEPHPKLPGTIYTAAKEIEVAASKWMKFLNNCLHARALRGFARRDCLRFRKESSLP